MRMFTRVSTTCCVVLATLILGLSIPDSAVGRKDTRETFTPVLDVPDGLAVVYIFRKKRDGRWLMTVIANGRLVAALPEDKKKGRYLPIFVPPGEIVLDAILTPTGFERANIGEHRAVPVTLQVESGKEYYVVKSKFGKITLRIPSEKDVEKHLIPSVMAEAPPGALGQYHYYHADVFLDLAFNQDEAGQRDAAERALQKAAEHYNSAATAFSLPIPEERRSFWISMLDYMSLFVAYPDEDAYTGMARAASAIRYRRSLEAALADRNAARVGDVGTLARRMDELANMVSAAHACYVGANVPSLEQCSGEL